MGFKSLRVLVVTLAVERFQIARNELNRNIPENRPGSGNFIVRNIANDVLVAGFFSRGRVRFLDVLNGADHIKKPHRYDDGGEFPAGRMKEYRSELGDGELRQMKR